jgi:hypothetical protein
VEAAVAQPCPMLGERVQAFSGERCDLLPLITFNYQNQPARLEPSRKAFRRGGPRLPVPDPFGQGLATGMAPATVNPALLGKWYGPAERNRSAALHKRHIWHQFPCAYGSGQRAHIPDPNSPPRRL